MGMSHRTAPVEVRERHAFPATKMGETLIALRDYEAIHEAVMLQTCGRLEIYAEVESVEPGTTQLRAFLRNFRHAGVDDLSSYLYTLLDHEAVDHLFRVTTGLDSMLIGEAEILGQVKDAYVQAHRAGSLGKSLHALFREALSAGKAARTQTAIGREFVSVATAAVDLAKQRLGSLTGTSVLVVGAGKMGATAAKRLKHEGAGELVIANRTAQRANEIVRRLATGSVRELPSLPEAVREADIVVTSTGAETFLITRELVRDAMRSRPERPLFIVDIAVPRDVDPEVAHLPNVSVADIDSLTGAVTANLEQRRAAIPLVEEIISEHTGRYEHRHRELQTIPTVSALVRRSEAIRASEIERLIARCPELSERERMLITGASLSIVSKLLHPAITSIREAAALGRDEAIAYTKLIETLFELGAGEIPSPMKPATRERVS
jgi:glutamyl-tRNA reductase